MTSLVEAELREHARLIAERPAKLENMNDLERAIFAAAFVRCLPDAHFRAAPSTVNDESVLLHRAQAAQAARRAAFAAVEWFRRSELP